MAAVDEVIAQRRFRRLGSLVEASIWVAGGLIVAAALHAMPPVPPGHAAGAWTALGGALLGLGVWIIGGCECGAVAHLGSGQWAYALTPLDGLILVGMPLLRPHAWLAFATMCATVAAALLASRALAARRLRRTAG